MSDSFRKNEEIERALEEITDRYRRLQTNIPGMIYQFALHPDGTYSFPYVNDASRKLFNIEPEDLMRDWTLVSALIHPGDRARFVESVKSSAETLLPWREEIRHIVDGEVRWFDCMSRPELQPNGEILWDGIILEITDRKRMESELVKREHLLNNIIDQNPFAIWISDEKGTLIRINKTLCDMLKIRKEEVLGSYNVLKDNIVEEQGYHPLVQSVFDKGETVHFTLDYDSAQLKQLKFEQSARVIVETTISPVEDENGAVTNAVCMHRDVTDRKQWEEALQRSEEKFRNTFEQAAAGIAHVGLDGKWLRVNQRLCDIVGYPREELMNLTFQDITYKEDLERDLGYVRQMLEGEIQTYALEKRYVRKEIPMQPWVAEILQKVIESDGAVRLGPLEENPVPADGRTQFQIQSIMAMALYVRGTKPWMFGLHQCSFPRVWSADEKVLFQEIARRIADSLANLLAFRELQKSEERFRTLVENIPGVVYRSQLQDPGRVSYISDAVIEITGYPARDFVETQKINFGELILSEDTQMVERVVNQGINRRTPYEIFYRIRHASGGIRWVYEKGRCTYDDDETPIWLDGVIVDITKSRYHQKQNGRRGPAP